MLSKFLNISGCLLCGCLSGGLYGAIHDQISFSLSPEYFTQFKFQQFNIPEESYNRLGVAIVGWRATWWFSGLLLGGVLTTRFAITKSLAFSSGEMAQTFLWILAFSALGGFAFAGICWIDIRIAFPFGGIHSSTLVTDREASFLVVGMMHNGAYCGSIVGALLCIVKHAANSRRLS